MVYYENETKQKMSNSYGDMTPVERSIADFFLSNAEKMDFSSKKRYGNLHPRGVCGSVWTDCVVEPVLF